MSSLPSLSSLIPEPVWQHFTTTNILGAVFAGLVAIYVYCYPYREATCSFKNLPGPKSDHWFWGNLTGVVKSGPGEKHLEWFKSYGPTLRYKIFLGTPRLVTADPVALGFILNHPEAFPKPERARKQMAEMLGEGVLVAEGATHRRQRRLLNPSFSPAAVRDMQPIFYDKAYELRDKLLTIIEDESIEASPSPAKEEDKVPGARKVDVMRYLGQATLDVIGLAGFNYDFASLSSTTNELAEAYRALFSVGAEVSLLAVMQVFVPLMKYIPSKQVRVTRKSTAITRRIGQQLVDDKKRAVKALYAGELEKGTDIGKDLLSHLIKANMAGDLKPEQQLSDYEVLAQITTFMLAGNETSSTALTWILYCLSLNPSAQTKLREEAVAVPDERPTPETLASLTYMDQVIHEVLRLYAPAPSTIRTTVKDMVIPLGYPVKGRDGKMVDNVTVKKGQTIFIPILCVNTLPDIWGPDAAEFKPERWQKLPDGVMQVPGVWGNILTFLGGTRNCIGYRFALAEIRAILFVLMRNFEFEKLPSNPEIERKSSIVMRPRLKDEKDKGMQMPLLVKPLSSSS